MQEKQGIDSLTQDVLDWLASLGIVLKDMPKGRVLEVDSCPIARALATLFKRPVVSPYNLGGSGRYSYFVGGK